MNCIELSKLKQIIWNAALYRQENTIICIDEEKAEELMIALNKLYLGDVILK